VSRLNHDCAPNLGYYFDSASLTLKVYAVRDIFPGEELTISYVEFVRPGNPPLPTQEVTNTLML
jgi:SET domain-containing protein